MRALLVAVGLALLQSGGPAIRVLPEAPRGMAMEERNGDNIPYDGRFVFARIRYQVSGFGFRGDPPWRHDHPRAERHFTKILSELSTIVSYQDGGNVFTLDDPELFKYPVAYMAEPGFWTLTEKEAEAFRAYLAKGGFAIFDDFAGDQWINFAERMREVLPDGMLVELTPEHPIFDSFFRIESLEFRHPYWGQFPSRFFGIYEDNDPSKRLLVIVNYNNDIAEYWEWSDTDWAPIELSNEAYKLGVNYIVYAMTH